MDPLAVREELAGWRLWHARKFRRMGDFLDARGALHEYKRPFVN